MRSEMTAMEVRSVIAELGDRVDVAKFMGVSYRTVRRWESEGVGGAAVAAFKAALQCKRKMGIWRQGEAQILLTEKGLQIGESIPL
jgi:hypothetical protein